MSERGEKLRNDVLGVLRDSDSPLSAYAVLEQLKDGHPKIAPTTVYRALSTLIERGCVHRIESLNAYFACSGDMNHPESILSICDDCGNVDERVEPGLVSELSNLVSESGFVPKRHVIEVHGLCGPCGAEKTHE